MLTPRKLMVMAVLLVVGAVPMSLATGSVLELLGVAPMSLAAADDDDEKGHDDDDSGDREALEEAMGKLRGGLRQLRGVSRGDDVGGAAAIAASMQAAVLVAKGKTPPKLAKVADETERAAQLKEYRLTMIALMRELLVLEEAALKDDTKAVRAAFEKLRAVQQKGHDRFREDEKRRGGERRRGG